MSSMTGKPLITTGGLVQVCTNGTMLKATLLDPDNNYVALANPFAATRGKFRFAVAITANPVTVDLYGYSQLSHAFVRKSVTPGDPTEIYIDGNRRKECLVVPFSVADCTPGTEKDTGFVLPAGAVVDGHPVVVVTVASGVGSKTIIAGLLSSQSGGDADGFIVAPSLTSIATIVTKLASTGTLGALLFETTTGAAAVIPVPYVVGATAINVSYTLTAAATLAQGYFTLDYTLPAAS